MRTYLSVGKRKLDRLLKVGKWLRDSTVGSKGHLTLRMFDETPLTCQLAIREDGFGHPIEGEIIYHSSDVLVFAQLI